ncbi:hypothetical protein ACLQ24_23015 [Micromonospora sp. DT4]|uniref:hypothetical protein n=1 Tax=Micromonospora sp. DT4 TaxID=3393438 RepID=UPI003CF468D7
MAVATVRAGEALRASMPASRSRSVFGQLADVLASMPLRRRDDALVAGVWQLRSGSVRAALAVGQAVLARPDTGVRAASWATMGAASAAGMLGRLGRLGLAAELARRGRAVLAAAPEHLPWHEAQVGLGLCYARYAAGELAEAVELADEGYRAAVASDARGMVGVWAGFRGIIGKAQGQLDAAEADLREAIALVEENDQYHLVRTYWAELAGVRALAGDLPGARCWLAAADARERTANRIFHAWVELNRAWVQVAEGDLTAAIRTARHAADLARGSEQPTIEAVALYECVRLGARSRYGIAWAPSPIGQYGWMQFKAYLSAAVLCYIPPQPVSMLSPLIDPLWVGTV